MQAVLTPVDDFPALGVPVGQDRREIERAVKSIRESEARLEAFDPLSDSRGALVPDGPAQRRHPRFPIERGALLLPATVPHEDPSRCEPRPPSILVMTRNISVSGIGFTHDEPLLTEHGIVTFNLAPAGCVSLLVEQRWCRRVNRFYWISGCRIVGVIDLPKGQ